MDVIRRSFSGTTTEAWTSPSVIGNFDVSISTPQMANNSSQWDYYVVDVESSAIQLYGAAAVVN